MQPDTEKITHQVTTLARPDGRRIQVKILSTPDWDGQFRVRYWQPLQNGRQVPIESMVRLCLIHLISYTDFEFPKGCPDCQKKTLREPLQKASLFK